MNKSPTIAALSAALAKAQAELRNPKFDSVNPHFRSSFASLSAVREAVIPVFAKHGLSLSQFPTAHEGKAGCINHLAHESGEWMEEPFLIPCDKQNSHGYASALTYARRLSMQSVAGVCGDADDDGNGSVNNGLSESQIADFTAAMEGAKSKDELAEIWKKASAACNAASDDSSRAVLKKIATKIAEKL